MIYIINMLEGTLPRLVAQGLEDRLRVMPAVVVTGARQNTIRGLPETVYEASHPSIAGSVMNYNGEIGVDEPDCWPHPFDIMAINSLYQADYP